MGEGTKANELSIVSEKPIAAVLSFSSMQRTPTKKFEDLPAAPTNLRRQTTARKV